MKNATFKSTESCHKIATVSLTPKDISVSLQTPVSLKHQAEDYSGDCLIIHSKNQSMVHIQISLC